MALIRNHSFPDVNNQARSGVFHSWLASKKERRMKIHPELLKKKPNKMEKFKPSGWGNMLNLGKKSVASNIAHDKSETIPREKDWYVVPSLGTAISYTNHREVPQQSFEEDEEVYATTISQSDGERLRFELKPGAGLWISREGISLQKVRKIVERYVMRGHVRFRPMFGSGDDQMSHQQYSNNLNAQN